MTKTRTQDTATSDVQAREKRNRYEDDRSIALPGQKELDVHARQDNSQDKIPQKLKPNSHREI